MTGIIVVAVSGVALAVLGAIVGELSAASVDDDLMALADAVQGDVDAPVPFLPVDLPTTAPDREWLLMIGVEP